MKYEELFENILEVEPSSDLTKNIMDKVKSEDIKKETFNNEKKELQKSSFNYKPILSIAAVLVLSLSLFFSSDMFKMGSEKGETDGIILGAGNTSDYLTVETYSPNIDLDDNMVDASKLENNNDLLSGFDYIYSDEIIKTNSDNDEMILYDIFINEKCLDKLDEVLEKNNLYYNEILDSEMDGYIHIKIFEKVNN